MEPARQALTRYASSSPHPYNQQQANHWMDNNKHRAKQAQDTLNSWRAALAQAIHYKAIMQLHHHPARPHKQRESVWDKQNSSSKPRQTNIHYIDNRETQFTYNRYTPTNQPKKSNEGNKLGESFSHTEERERRQMVGRLEKRSTLPSS